MKNFYRVVVCGILGLFNSGISYGAAVAVYDDDSVSRVLTPSKIARVSEEKGKKAKPVDLAPGEWCYNYQYWRQSVKQLAENCCSDFVSEADGYSRRWNRSMNKFFRLYNGTWTSAEFEEAKSELKRIIDLEGVDPVLKEALDGHYRALGILEGIDFSQNY